MSNYTERLGQEKIGKLLFRQSLPAVIGMLVMSLYNLVDTIFIGRGVGMLGIAGVAIVFPIQIILISLAQMVGIGSASVISRNLGAKDYSKAKDALGNGFFLVVIMSLAFTIFGLIFIKPLLIIFGATSTILPYSIEYLSVILLGSIFLSIAMAGNNVIRSEGNAKFAMIVMVVSALINIILDPIFIFGLGMGMRGAAIATVIAQISAALCAVYFFIRKSTVSIAWRNMKLKISIVKEILGIGSSSFARTGSTSIMTLVMNHSLGIYGGDLAIAAFGVVNRIMMFMFMPIFGIVQGLQPIVGYNYGSKLYVRTKKTIFLSMKVIVGMSLVSTIIIFIFAEPIAKIFTQDLELILMASRAMRIIVIAVPLVGIQTIASGVYQSLGKAVPAFVISILKPVAFLIPLVLILPLFFGLDGIWITFPLSDVLFMFIVGWMLWREFKILGNEKE